MAMIAVGYQAEADILEERDRIREIDERSADLLRQLFLIRNGKNS